MNAQLNDCTGKVALVSGAATGIGLACANALADAGAHVVVSDIDEARIHEAAKSITDKGGQARALVQDVTDEAVWQQTIADIRTHEGRLNVLVNNAGIAVGGSIIDMTLDDWRRQNAVNLDGVFLATKYALPLMAESGAGSIINISSIAGLVGASGLAGYCASKGGVRLFTKATAMECAQGELNIRANSVHPGLIDTEIWGKEIAAIAEQNPDLMAEGANRIDLHALSAVSVPGGRAGQPQEIAGVVVFLASDASSYVNAAELVVDYGQTAR
jgi:NAD(P)-dependent dehydrogenase (short-subunit alcohol dehydrogenase family)